MAKFYMKKLIVSLSQNYYKNFKILNTSIWPANFMGLK